MVHGAPAVMSVIRRRRTVRADDPPASPAVPAFARAACVGAQPPAGFLPPGQLFDQDPCPPPWLAHGPVPNPASAGASSRAGGSAWSSKPVNRRSRWVGPLALPRLQPLVALESGRALDGAAVARHACSALVLLAPPAAGRESARTPWETWAYGRVNAPPAGSECASGGSSHDRL